jgi:hypothetical protein
MEVDSLGVYVKHQDVSNPPAAQPAPAPTAPENVWRYWKINDSCGVTGPFKTTSKEEAYGPDCIDAAPLTVSAPVPLTDDQIEKKFKSRFGEDSWRVIGAFYYEGHRDSEAAHGITASPEKGGAA